MEPLNEFAHAYLASFEQARLELNQAISASDEVNLQEWVRQGRRMESVDDVLAPTGCDLSEIDRVRQAWSGWMPASFAGFLQVMGTMKRHIDLGANCYFPAVLEAAEDLRAWHVELANQSPDRFEAGDYEVPTGAVPIGHHEGYRFAFFADRTDDPQVLWLREGADTAATVDNITFSERVHTAIANRATTEITRLDRIKNRQR